MRRKSAIILSLTMALSASQPAQAQDWPSAALAEAACGAASCEQGFVSVGQNPAGTACSPLGAAIGCSSKFGLKELQQKTALLAVPVWRGAASAAFRYYGFSLFNTSHAQMSYAMPLGKSLSAGISMNLLCIHIDDAAGTMKAAAGDIGIQYRISSRWMAGSWISNIANSQYSETDTIIPVRIQAGIRRIFTGGHSASLDVEKSSLCDKIILRGAFAVRILERASIVCGISTWPLTIGAGMEFQLRGFCLQFAARRNEHLGWIPSASVAWRAKGRAGEGLVSD